MTTVHLFPDEPPRSRPAWQVIDAARDMRLTGELTLRTTPATRVYLRDGVVYFADRATDGSLGIRLVLEGVLSRAQLANGTVVVNGAEHLGRLFDREPSVDRDAVELAVEMFVDDVLTRVAEESVDEWHIELYKRHLSGLDRWYPHVTRVVTRVVERATVAHVEPAPAIAESRAVTEPAAVVEPVVEPSVEPVAQPAPVVVEPVAEPVVVEQPAPAPAPVRAPLPAPSMEIAAVISPPAPILPPKAEAQAPTDVVPVLEVDVLLQPRLATGQTEVIAPVEVPAAEPTAVAEPQEVPADDEPEVAAASVDDLIDGGSGNLADDIAEAIRRTMSAYQSA